MNLFLQFCGIYRMMLLNFILSYLDWWNVVWIYVYFVTTNLPLQCFMVYILYTIIINYYWKVYINIISVIFSEKNCTNILF